MIVVIVPSREFFFTKTNKQKKTRLGLTSTYKYKTIHTSVWMLPQGRMGVGVLFFVAQLSLPVPRV